MIFMRILVISRSPWRNDNSFGNTYTNIFNGMQDVTIANIYLADGFPDGQNQVVTHYYQMSESKLLKSVRNFCKGKKVGNEVFINSIDSNSKEETSTKIAVVKKKRWSVFFIAREFLWKIGNTNLSEMIEFVKEFNPDIVFLPFYYAKYVSNMAMYILDRICVPLVLEASIDIYSLKQLSFDPFFWINRFAIRSTIRKVVKRAQKLYVISQKMKYDYEKMLKIDCSILYKFPEMSRKFETYKRNSIEKGLVFLYTGNIGNGRWRSLALAGDAIISSGVGKLKIYTPTKLTCKMRESLKNCEVYPPVVSDCVIKLQNEADVLIHAESFKLKERLEVRYSISTKIMDYIGAGRCILAIGSKDIASIEFLKKNKIAIICDSKKAITQKINFLKNNPNIVKMYADQTTEYINSLPTKAQQQENLRKELLNIIEEYK